MKWLTQLVLLSVALMLGTWYGGWWMVPVIGALYGAWGARQKLTLITSTLAAVVAWGALLAYDAASGPLGRELEMMGSMFRLPGAALVVLTLAYGALLCVSAAATVRGLRR